MKALDQKSQLICDGRTIILYITEHTGKELGVH